MKLLHVAGLTLGTLSATSWSQDSCRSTGEPAACCATDGGAGQAAATTLSLPLRGMRGQTEDALVKALQSIGRDSYQCAGHPEATRDEPGVCEACGGGALSRRHVPAFQSLVLEVSGMAQTCRVQLTPGESVRLSAITSALEESGVSLELDELRLQEETRLHIAGLNYAGCEGKASAALEGLEGVVASSCSFDTSEESLASLSLDGSGGTGYRKVQQALTGAGLSLEDVSWVGAGTQRSKPSYDLGITGFAKRLGAQSELLIHGLVPGGAAEKAGLKEGDRIVTINGGVAFEFTREELSELFAEPVAVSFEIQRGDEAFSLAVTPEARVQDETSGACSDESRAEAERKPRKKPTRGLSLGEAAPAIVGEDLDGIPFELADYRGKVTVVSYWGFW